MKTETKEPKPEILTKLKDILRRVRDIDQKVDHIIETIHDLCFRRKGNGRAKP